MIPISSELRALIIAMKSKASGEFVFGGDQPLEPAHFGRSLLQDLNKVPTLKKINFHGLRHTFCTHLDSTGLPRRIVAEIMGHRDLSTTDRYSHVSNPIMGMEFGQWLENQSKQHLSNILEVVI